MKRVLLLMVICMLVSMPFVMAEDTGPADWDKDLGWLNKGRDYAGGHDHSYEQYDPEFEVGIGLDLVVYENEDKGLAPNEVTIESKYDFQNENGSVYVVAKYNIWDRFFSGE